MPSLHLVMHEPEIHWNTGNLGRTSLALGAELHLIEPLGFSLDDRRVRRAGLDYWPRVRLRVWPDWERFEHELPKLGAPYFFCAAAERDYWDADFPDDVVLVFGRETVGLPDWLVARYPDRALRIPMERDSVRSLNVSTAAAVAAFEVARQHRTRR